MITNNEIELRVNAYAGLSRGYELMKTVLAGEKAPDTGTDDDLCFRSAIKHFDKFPPSLNHLSEYTA